MQDTYKHCAVRHKKLECLQVWIFWRSTREEGVLFLSLFSGVLSANKACFLQQTLAACLQILLSPFTLTDVFTLGTAFLPSRFSSFNSVTLLEQACLSLASVRVVVHYSHSQKQNHVWDKHFHLNFKSLDSS